MAGNDEQTGRISPFAGFFLPAFYEIGIGFVTRNHFPEQLAYLLDTFLIEQIEARRFSPVVVGGMAGNLDQFPDEGGIGYPIGKVCRL